jgi:hypothetical protein
VLFITGRALPHGRRTVLGNALGGVETSVVAFNAIKPAGAAHHGDGRPS